MKLFVITAERETMYFFGHVENLDTRTSSPKWGDRVVFLTSGSIFFETIPHRNPIVRLFERA